MTRTAAQELAERIGRELDAEEPADSDDDEAATQTRRKPKRARLAVEAQSEAEVNAIKDLFEFVTAAADQLEKPEALPDGDAVRGPDNPTVASGNGRSDNIPFRGGQL